MKHFILGAMFAVLAIITQPGEVAAKTQLTPAEVRAIFIGTPWKNNDGVFLFRDDGTYSYRRLNEVTERGTWEYQMLEDGTLTGGSTNYTFYRRNNGKFVYFHSRSRKHFPAIPNVPSFEKQ